MDTEIITSSSTTSQNFIIKVQINEFKLKFQVKNPQSTLKVLKADLFENLRKLNYALQDDAEGMFALADDQGFVFAEDDIIQDLIKHNDFIKLIAILSQNQVDNKQSANLTDNQQSDNLSDNSNNLVKVKEVDQQDQQDQEVGNTQNQIDVEYKPEEPKEAIVILYDISGSMASQFFTEKGLPRIGAVNAFFSAFADKTLAMEYNHVVSLYWFDSKIEKKCDFINDMNTFIKLVDDASPRGGTRLYDALVEGINSLVEYKRDHPSTILRMIALTDGEDNESKFKPSEVAALFLKHRIILDSFVVSKQSLQLKTITHASGGRCYCPMSINDGLKLFEIETILSVRARDINLEEFYSKSHKEGDSDASIDLSRFQDLNFDTEGLQVNYDKQIQQPSADISQILAKYQKIADNPSSSASSTNNSSSNGPSQAVLKRILKELETIQKESEPNFKARVFPAADDITNWKVLLIGPEGSPYNYGVYMVHVQFPADYPFKPPRIRFITPIYHCNISSQGHMCLDILKDQWSPALTIQKSLNSFLSLMSCPNPDDAIDSTIAAQYLQDKPGFQKSCLEHTKANANKTVEELLVDIMGSSLDVNNDFYKNAHEDLTKWLANNKSKF